VTTPTPHRFDPYNHPVALRPDPGVSTEPAYTFHITPSTLDARERIADGAESPSLLRGTLAQGRDLARLLDASINLLDGRGYLAIHVKADGNYSRIGEPDCPVEMRPPARPLAVVSAAAAAADRLIELGWTTATVTFHATGFALAGAYFNDEAGWFVATVSEAKDEEVGGSVVGLEFRAQNRDAPLVVVEHADDLVTALLIAIDDNL
jgi:hypothetical protein